MFYRLQGNEAHHEGPGTMPINEHATAFTYGTAGNDTILAEFAFGDLIDGLAGDDVITGLDGGDVLLGNSGRDTLYGMGGNDTLDGGAGADRLYGGWGDDSLHPDSGGIANDYVDGGDGIDTIDYSTAPVTTRGVTVNLGLTAAQDTKGAGKDTILNVENAVGTFLADTITGNAFANVLSGFNGNDTLSGLDGHDQLFGGAGNDKLLGGLGNDMMISDNDGIGNDVIDGGSGIDTVDYIRSAVTSGVSVDLNLTTAQNTGGSGLDTILNVEQVIGSRFNDVITGNAADNWLQGNQGSDTISGGAGNDMLFAGAGDFGTVNTLDGGLGDDKLSGGSGADTLTGGSGNDRLMGGQGTDSLSGGAGADLFYFAGSDSNPAAADTILDYNGVEDDIVVQSFMLTGTATFIGSDAFTASGHTEYRVTEAAGVQRLEIDFAGDGFNNGDTVIQVIGTAISAADITFVTSFLF